MTVITKKSVLSLWILSGALFALFAAPASAAANLLLLFFGLMVPVIVFIVWREPAITVAEVLHQTETPRTEG